MAEETRSGGIAPLYFIVGGLVVAVGVGAFILYGGDIGTGPTATTTIEQSSTTQPAAEGSTTTTTTTQETQE